MDIFFRNQIIQNIEHIGTAPEVSLKIMEIANRQDIDLDEVIELILKEPTISAQILKMANSSYFYRGERINNVSGAVVHLGLENVRRLLLAIELIGIFRANSHSTFFNEVNFWKHSVAGAVLASELGKAGGDEETESFYICGLLKNLGVLAIRQFLPEEFHKIYDMIGKQHQTFKNGSKAVIGIDHREIAHLISLRWNLPERIVSAVSEMDYRGAGNNMVHRIVNAVNTADAALSVWGLMSGTRLTGLFSTWKTRTH